MIITIPAIVLSTLAGASNPQPIPNTTPLPPCVKAPDNSSQETIDCYNQACKVYQAAYQACDSSQCRLEARAVYLIQIGTCVDNARIHWAGKLISYDGSSWTMTDAPAPTDSIISFGH